jgi:hypothetical protein
MVSSRRDKRRHPAVPAPGLGAAPVRGLRPVEGDGATMVTLMIERTGA